MESNTKKVKKKCWIHPFYYKSLHPCELYILVFDGDNYATLNINKNIVLFQEKSLEEWVLHNSALYEIIYELDENDFDVDEALKVLYETHYDKYCYLLNIINLFDDILITMGLKNNLSSENQLLLSDLIIFLTFNQDLSEHEKFFSIKNLYIKAFESLLDEIICRIQIE